MPKRKIKSINYGDFYSPSNRALAAETKHFINEVNKLITSYNKPTKEFKKVELLKQIEEKIKEFDYRYNQEQLESAKSYHAIRARLFREVQNQYDLLGVQKEYSSLVEETLSRMSPEKMDDFLHIFSEYKIDRKKDIESQVQKLRTALTKLYRNDTSEESKRYEQFLKAYQINFLGGGNSQNFKLTDLKDNSDLVLKIENRLNMPREAEVYLRKYLGKLFTPLYVDRPALVNGKNIYRTIQVTEFCPAGSVHEHSRKKSSNEERAQNIQVIFRQMAKTMLDIQKMGYFFSDSKITNWLVNENNQIRIADTKSFVAINEQGIYSRKLPKNKYFSFVKTPDFMPSEFENKYGSKLINADKAHSYILGKNLYIYATGRQGKTEEGKDFDFNFSFFTTPEGREYKQLITELVRAKPEDRLCLTEALTRITLMNNPEKELIKNLASKEYPLHPMPLTETMDHLIRTRHPDYDLIFNKLDALRFGKEDKLLDQFIWNKKDLIRSSPDPTPIIAELKIVVTQLDNEATKEIKTIISNCRERAGIFSMGMKTKAKRIEQEMQDLSIEDRCDFASSNKFKEVMEVLASHTHYGKRNKVYFTKTGEIDTKKAAKTYKEFKEKFQSLTTEKHTEESQEKHSKKS
jgi:serine/threonine protein kinase